MQLTTKKLESLIQEMIEESSNQFSREQKTKILSLIKQTRGMIRNVEKVGGFFPPIINAVYSYDKEEDIQKAIRNSVRASHVKKAIMNHYSAITRMAGILEEVNQFLVLFEDVEITGNLARHAKGMLYDGTKGIETVNGPVIKFFQLNGVIDTAIMFLEDIEKLMPEYFGEGNLGLKTLRNIFEAFVENYYSLKHYLDSVT